MSYVLWFGSSVREPKCRSEYDGDVAVVRSYEEAKGTMEFLGIPDEIVFNHSRDRWDDNHTGTEAVKIVELVSKVAKGFPRVKYEGDAPYPYLVEVVRRKVGWLRPDGSHDNMLIRI